MRLVGDKTWPDYNAAVGVFKVHTTWPKTP
jgi:hypothetical protein